MTRIIYRFRHRAGALLLACLVSQAASVAAQDALAHAKDLYLSADYDEALVLLDRLQADAPPGVVTDVAQYRLFCLLALDRGEDAQAAIVGIVSADPFYRPSETLTSPRVRAVFQSTRKALLPSVVQRSYEEGKALFDRKDPQAVAQFERVLKLLDDPDLKGMAQLSDLRTVVSGFRDLSQVLAAPLPSTMVKPSAQLSPDIPSQNVPAKIPAPVKNTPQVVPAKSATASRNGRPVITPQEPPAEPTLAPEAERREPILTPPVVVFQPVPRWTPPTAVEERQSFTGSIAVMIDEAGNVATATLRQSVHPLFDAELLRVAKTWKYKPATRDGVPTSYLRIVEINLKPVR